jgi:hypothetical protein
MPSDHRHKRKKDGQSLLYECCPSFFSTEEKITYALIRRNVIISKGRTEKVTV